MRRPFEYVQKAIYERLTQGSRKINYPVFDHVPADQNSDFINFFNTTGDTQEKSSKDCPVWVLFYTFNCHSTYLGQKRVNEMLAAIDESLTYIIEGNDYVPLIVDNFNVNYIEINDSRSDEVPSLPAFRSKGSLTVELWVQEI